MRNDCCCKIVRKLPQFVEGTSFVSIQMDYDDWSSGRGGEEKWRVTLFRPNGKNYHTSSGRGNELGTALKNLCDGLGEPIPNIDDQSDPWATGSEPAEFFSKPLFEPEPRGQEEARELEKDRTPERWDGQG